jgi:hypothetical protein
MTTDIDTHGLETVDSDFENISEELGAASIMGSNGDTKIIWDPKKESDVKSAEAIFKDMRAKNYLAFRVKGRKSEQGEQLNEFDPKAGRMLLIFVPPFQGG